MASLDIANFSFNLDADEKRVLKVVDAPMGGQELFLNGVEIKNVLAIPRPYLLPAYSHGSGELMPGQFDLTLTIRVNLDPNSVELRPRSFCTPSYCEPDDDSSD